MKDYDKYDGIENVVTFDKKKFCSNESRNHKISNDHLIKDILRVLNEDSSDDDESVNNSEEEISHSNNIVYEVLPSNGLRRSNQKMTSSKSVTPVKLKRKFLRDDETYTKKRKLNVDETNSTLNDYCSNKISDRKNRTEKFCKRSAVVDTNSTRSNYESEIVSTPESTRSSSRKKKPKKIFDPGSISTDGQRYLEEDYTSRPIVLSQEPDTVAEQQVTPKRKSITVTSVRSSSRRSKRRNLFGKDVDDAQNEDVSDEMAEDIPIASSVNAKKISCEKNRLSTPKYAKSLLSTPKCNEDITETSVRSSSRKSNRKCLFGKPNVSSRDSSPENVHTTPKRSKRTLSVKDSLITSKKVDSPKGVKQEDLLRAANVTTPTHFTTNILSTPRHRLKSLTPGLSARKNILRTPTTPLDHARQLLHVSTIPDSLPCRQNEFDTIYKYLLKKIHTKMGGSMYISGVPGTGKTATVHRVVKKLEQDCKMKKIPYFEFVEINSLQLTEPHQAYCKFWKKLTGHTVTAEQAQKLLEKKFSSVKSKKEIIVLLIDELDYLCNRRQDVIYNILDWPSRSGSRLIVLTIANTMDLPERTLKGRVTSRMGLTRLVFQPYSYHQLQTIVLNRLSENDSFNPDAVLLAARKVASISGDARRALDICRRAIDISSAENSLNTVTIDHVEEAVTSIMSNTMVLVIKCCSDVEQLVLRSVRDECMSSGLDACTLDKMYEQFQALCTLEGVTTVPTMADMFCVCAGLEENGLILVEKGKNVGIKKKLSLNVSSDDIHYALNL